jgi:hypothetical protein
MYLEGLDTDNLGMIVASRTNAQILERFYPGVAPEDRVAYVRMLNGQPVGPAHRVIVDHFYHRRAYAATGQNVLEFFNARELKGVTNFNAEVLPDRPFAVLGFSLWFADFIVNETNGAVTFYGASTNKNGFTDAGTIGATGQNEINAAGSPLARAREIDFAFETGLWQFEVNSDIVFKGADLYRWPRGGGPNISTALSAAGTFTATNLTAVSHANLNNGDPFIANRNRFPAALALTPGNRPVFRTEWLTLAPVSVNAGANAGTLVAEMYGVSLQRRNRTS